MTQEEPHDPGRHGMNEPRTESAAELKFYLHGALIAYPADRTEAILAVAMEYVAKIEAEAAEERRLERSRVDLQLLIEAHQNAWGLRKSDQNNALAEKIAAEYARLSDSEGERPCSGCGGSRWAEDENWSPDDPATWRGERSPGNGLIPCGFCNLGGWDTPVGSRTDGEPDR